ncbi:MAG: hypothetical protein K2P64_05675, partial [Lachnospiraceae bacterium]|nr:hypothetical protein [Lachnospiraceae bacterium]
TEASCMTGRKKPSKDRKAKVSHSYFSSAGGCPYAGSPAPAVFGMVVTTFYKIAYVPDSVKGN